MDDEWKRSFDEIKEKHDLAFKTIDVAKKFDSNNNSELAIVNYKISIELIDKALATPVALPDDTDTLDDTWDTALQMIQKMKRTRGELLHRIVQLSPSTSNGKSEETKEKKEEITSTENGSKENKTRPRTFLELAEALQNFEVDTNELPSVLELLLVCENVKIYHIKASGEVTTTDEFSTLRIVRLDQDIERNLEVTYFLQIIRSSTAAKIDHKIITSMERSDVNQNKLERCETIESESPRSSPPRLSTDVSIIYPLIPGVSPCFRTDFDAFIFPDLESDEIGGAFGIVIPKVYDEIVLEILEAVLHGVVRQSELGEEEEEEDAEGRSLDDEILRKRARRATSEAISDNIVKGACFVSHGLVKGSEQIGRFMSFATPYLISKMNKAPEGEASVLSKVHQGVEIAKIATNAAAGVTGYVAQKVGNATTALGRFLAPHVHAQGAKLLSNTVGLNSDEASDKMNGVLTVAAGAVEGFGTIYSSLETSASILGHNISNNSVKIIEHKYGPSAGDVAAGTFDTVGNMINFSRNIGYVTPIGLAKTTVKGTGKAIVIDFATRSSTRSYVPAASLYPDLTEFSKRLSKPTL